MLATGAPRIEQVLWTPVAERAVDERAHDDPPVASRELVAAGLAPPEKLADWRASRARYAVAITPAIAALIDRADPHDPIARQFVPDVAELDDHAGRARRSDRRRRAFAGRRHRASLSGPRAAQARATSARSIAASASAARWSGRASRCSRPTSSTRRSTTSRAHPEIWEVILTGGDPLVLSPRRLGAVDRAHRRDRACEDRALAHARAGRRAGADHAGAGARAEGAAARPPTSRCTPTIRAN